MKLIAPMLVIPIIFLSSCGVFNRMTIKTTFDKKEYEPYSKNGSGKISGQLFAKTRGGDIKQGAGEYVYLFPATAYVKDIISQLRTKEQPALEQFGLLKEQCDPMWVNSLRTPINAVFDSTFQSDVICKLAKQVQCDGSSGFEFTNLPAGEYYVEAAISWVITSGPNGSSGATIRRFVTVKDGENSKIVMTP